MYKKLFFLICFSGIVNAWAQKSLLFYQQKSAKTIELKVGHRAAILYKGYTGQTEFFCETVTEISDSTIELGINLQNKYPSIALRPGKMNRITHKTIRIIDIIGFRRMTIGRQVAKLTLTTAGIIGSFYILPKIYSTGLSPTAAFFASLGYGIGILWLNNILFPENIKYYFEDGWSVKVLEE